MNNQHEKQKNDHFSKSKTELIIATRLIEVSVEVSYLFTAVGTLFFFFFFFFFLMKLAPGEGGL